MISKGDATRRVQDAIREAGIGASKTQSSYDRYDREMITSVAAADQRHLDVLTALPGVDRVRIVNSSAIVHWRDDA